MAKRWLDEDQMSSNADRVQNVLARRAHVRARILKKRQQLMQADPPQLYADSLELIRSNFLFFYLKKWSFE